MFYYVNKNLIFSIEWYLPNSIKHKKKKMYFTY